MSLWETFGKKDNIGFTPNNSAFDGFLEEILDRQLPVREGNDFSKSDDAIVMRSNYRYGTRCPDCGRLVARITNLPAVRTCPNGNCSSKYEISGKGKGLAFKRLN